MFKIFVIIIIAVGIFFWYPTSGDPIKKEILSPTTQHSVQLPPAEHSKATVFLLSILPPYLQNKLGQIRYKKSG